MAPKKAKTKKKAKSSQAAAGGDDASRSSSMEQAAAAALEEEEEEEIPSLQKSTSAASTSQEPELKGGYQDGDEAPKAKEDSTPALLSVPRGPARTTCAPPEPLSTGQSISLPKQISMVLDDDFDVDIQVEGTGAGFSSEEITRLDLDDENTSVAEETSTQDDPANFQRWSPEWQEDAKFIQKQNRRYSALWKARAMGDGISSTSDGTVEILGPTEGKVFTKKKTLDLNEIGELPTYRKACKIVEGRGGISTMELWTPGRFKTEKVEYLFFVARWKWDAYLSGGNGSEVFSLEDLISANWSWNGNAKDAVITNLSKQSKDGKGKYGLHKIRPDYFKALLTVTMEAQYRKAHGFLPEEALFTGLDGGESLSEETFGAAFTIGSMTAERSTGVGSDASSSEPD